jgi:hypothetical protein
MKGVTGVTGVTGATGVTGVTGATGAREVIKLNKSPYQLWVDEYLSDLINLFCIVLRHTNVEDDDKNFNRFCRFVYFN